MSMAHQQTERIFTDDAMNRPLFEEPSEAIEREDPFTGPQGFMIGDEFIPRRPELAQQYFDAEHLIVESIKRGEWEDYKLVNHALFIYRHSLELLLKEIVGRNRRGHDLAELADALAKTVKARTGALMPSWIMNRLQEIASIDPGSTAFRYGENYDPIAKRPIPPVASAVYVSLPHLQRAMLTLNAALVGAIAEIATSHPVRYFDDD